MSPHSVFVYFPLKHCKALQSSASFCQSALHMLLCHLLVAAIVLSHFCNTIKPMSAWEPIGTSIVKVVPMVRFWGGTDIQKTKVTGWAYQCIKSRTIQWQFSCKKGVTEWQIWKKGSLDLKLHKVWAILTVFFLQSFIFICNFFQNLIISPENFDWKSKHRGLSGVKLWKKGGGDSVKKGGLLIGAWCIPANESTLPSLPPGLV